MVCGLSNGDIFNKHTNVIYNNTTLNVFENAVG